MMQSQSPMPARPSRRLPPAFPHASATAMAAEGLAARHDEAPGCSQRSSRFETAMVRMPCSDEVMDLELPLFQKYQMR